MFPEFLDPGDPRPAARAALRAWLELQCTLGLSPQLAAEKLRETRDPEAALERAGRGRVSPAWLDAAVAALVRAGAVGLPLLSPAYPPRLAALADPAPLLWTRGDPRVLSAPGVAVVGSRAASAYGLAVARELGHDLARSGLVVTSGLARGVDAAAHRGALEAGGRTLAFQACGPDRVYPAEHVRLAHEIASAGGAVVTEHAPGTAPLRPYFPLRNRLLTGSALALVVVEARERSGSLTSAAHAAHQDLDVFAVPGRIDAPTSAGPNALLQQGAYVARGAEDVLSLLEQRGHWRPAARCRAARRDAARESEIVTALRHAPAGRDELARRLGLAPERLALELLELELAGRIVEDRDGRLHPASPAPPRASRKRAQP